MVGGGIELAINLSDKISLGFKSGISRGIYKVIDDAKSYTLQREGILQLNSMIAQFDSYIGYAF